MPRFSSILVANRGEIALRVMKTARALGYRTIAVYSEADANAPHVSYADDAVCIGPAPVSESYLNVDEILRAAQATGAGAIHPGYGFLSENSEFASACEAAGLVFIGPPPEAIALMGNKAAAKRRMISAGVPCVPGYEDKNETDEKLIAAADQIDFPVMVKAAAGGGGRGMRLVAQAEDLPEALTSARSEALNAFGSSEMILEKAILQPRHVEVQIFADSHGNVIHLGERDCSVQRRHQKVIEEAPCPVMTDALRTAMGQAAVEAARSINYHGAGTVEFLLDASGTFFFLEMNTRLQVEHPVTEMITGLDLVALQISVAQGDPLPLSQEQLSLTGHAIEARLYAEDPSQGFLPVTGNVDLWQPASGDGLRIDSGIETGSEVSPFYDPMLAKIIAWGPDRNTALARLHAALNRTRLFGLQTNKGFLSQILTNDSFAAGQATTAFLDEDLPIDNLVPVALTETEAMISAVLQYEDARTRAIDASLGVNKELLNFSSTGSLQSSYRYLSGETPLDVTVTALSASYIVTCNASRAEITLEQHHGPDIRLKVNGQVITVGAFAPRPDHLHLDHDGRVFSLRNEHAVSTTSDEAGSNGRISAPMHGTLLAINVAVGDTVSKGDRLAVLEAMKMQHTIEAEVEGTIIDVQAREGSQVAADDVILIIEPLTAD